MDIIPTDNIKPNKNFTAAHKKAQYKYNAQHVEQIKENKLKWYHSIKDTQEFKALIKQYNKNSYQKRKEQIKLEKILNPDEPIIDAVIIVNDVKEKRKIYNARYASKHLIRMKAKHFCTECQCNYSLYNKSHHLNSKKHMNLFKFNDDERPL